MTYVFGIAAVTGAPLRLQNTVQRDDFASLSVAYGVTPQAIWAMQPEGGGSGKRFERKPVQAFAKSRPGWNAAEGLHPFSSALNPGTNGPDGKPEGFAHFTSKTQLMLPDMPRLDGKAPPGQPPPGQLKPVFPEPKQAGTSPILVAAGVAALVIFVALGTDKKKPKKGAPAPVKF